MYGIMCQSKKKLICHNLKLSIVINDVYVHKVQQSIFTEKTQGSLLYTYS